MTAALALSIAPEVAQAEALRERVQVLESRPGVREVLLVTEAPKRAPSERHVVLVLGGGGGGFAVVSRDGLPEVYGGLSPDQRQRLADTVGGVVIALSPPSDRPIMDREWRLSSAHVCDMRRAVDWARAQWPCSSAWVLGINNGALSAAVATASIDDLAGAVLLSCVDEALDQPQKSERMRVLAVRQRNGARASSNAPGECARRTLVSVHDERRVASAPEAGDAMQAPRFNGKEQQVVDVVARWILTGAAPDEIR
ncbi:MAG TPA: hypothetical protein VL326_24705 [Kofleriaceae bacterium]|nr:hypothetical protein [Kofleriaceae bacterium]